MSYHSLLAALLCSACVTVPPGSAAVIMRPSGAVAQLGEGVQLVSPWTTTELFDLRQQERNENLRALTADGASIQAGASLVTYRLAPDELLAFARETGSDVSDAYTVAIAPVVQSAVRRVLGQLTLAQLTTENLRRAQLQITQRAAEELRPLHIILEGVQLREVAPIATAYTAQVNATAEEEQRALAEQQSLLLAAQRALELRTEAEGLVASHQIIAPTLSASALEEMHARAWGELLASPHTTVVTAGPPLLEVTP